MSNTVPDWRNSIVAEAAMEFRNPVFTEWLDFRRRATDCLVPKWQLAPEADRVQLLDLCAVLQANRN